MSMNKRPPLRRSAPVETENDGVIEGRNAVIEALRSGTAIDKIYVARGETDAALGHIASTARGRGVVVVEADRRKLDNMSRTHAHQGVIALAAVREYASVEDILNAAREKGEPPLIVVCDELSDPHNLGAVIRSAAAFGANGVILPERRSASVTAAAWKVSAGAAAHMPVARVVNLTKAIESLKERGYYSVGLDGGGDALVGETGFETDPLVVVLGSEGNGLSRLVRETCDSIAGIPMSNMVESLNASVAAGITLYSVARARREAGAAADAK